MYDHDEEDQSEPLQGEDPDFRHPIQGSVAPEQWSSQGGHVEKPVIVHPHPNLQDVAPEMTQHLQSDNPQAPQVYDQGAAQLPYQNFNHPLPPPQGGMHRGGYQDQGDWPQQRHIRGAASVSRQRYKRVPVDQ